MYLNSVLIPISVQCSYMYLNPNLTTTIVHLNNINFNILTFRYTAMRFPVFCLQPNHQTDVGRGNPSSMRRSRSLNLKYSPFLKKYVFPFCHWNAASRSPTSPQRCSIDCG